MATNKGFIKDRNNNYLLPITRGELVLDSQGNVALTSSEYAAGVNGNEYGLISRQDLAKITGTSGQSLADVYNKLGHINTGIQVGTTSLNFYTVSGSTVTAKKITFAPATNAPIEISTADNTIKFGLKAINPTLPEHTSRIKDLTVDSYGRVTAVSYDAISDAELPSTLAGKTLKNGVVSEIAGAEIDEKGNVTYTNANAIMPKSYIDTQIAQVIRATSGGLTFAGGLSSWTIASSALNKANVLYKVTSSFNIPVEHFADTAFIPSGATEFTVKAGDSLIVYKPTDNATNNQFVYIPSGDDEVTTALSVYQDKDGGFDKILDKETGQILLQFTDKFNTIKTGSNGAYIDLKIASSTQTGVLSSADWIRFNSYATQEATTYTNSLTTSGATYTLGNLTVGGVDIPIYGKDTITTISLNNGYTEGENQHYDPILQVDTNVSDPVDFRFKGAKGIKVFKDGNAIEFNADISIPTVSQKYLTVTQGHQIGVKIGSVSGNTVTDGLTDYKEFDDFRTASITYHSTSVKFESIDTSLNATNPGEDDYVYGNAKLIAAINVTI